jgi:hypothetical protein
LEGESRGDILHRKGSELIARELKALLKNRSTFSLLSYDTSKERLLKKCNLEYSTVAHMISLFLCGLCVK